MKNLSVLLLSISCLLASCQRSGTAVPHPLLEIAVNDSAAIYQDRAYEEMFNGSLTKAEAYAYRAYLLSRDSVQACDALSLLCYVYYREGKQEDLQLLMQTISPVMYTNVMDVQLQVEQTKAGRQQLVYVVAIVVLLLLLGALVFWYFRRMKLLSRLYRQRISTVRQEMKEELQRLSAITPLTDTGDDNRPQLEIGETKTGIDVLFAIINDQNISQMGKREEQAVLKVIPVVDTALAAALSKAYTPLTPKETFFCIMEYFGKTDHQKARSFCCSEQAVRSTKSRLNKKMDISVLRAE